MNKNTTDFLDRLESLIYEGDENVSNAINYIRNHPNQDQAKEQIDTAMMMVNHCTEYMLIRPEVMICCFIGGDFENMQKNDVIHDFGYETYELARSLSQFPTDYNADAMFDLFMQQEEDVLLLYFTVAVKSLRLIYENETNYEYEFEEIEGLINLGETVRDDDYKQLRKELGDLTDFFVDYFEQKAELESNKTTIFENYKDFPNINSRCLPN